MLAIASSSQQPIARAGLVAKGVVYTLMGIMAIMAAFHLGGQSADDTDKQGVLTTIKEQTGGEIMLAIIAIGLACYTLWRFLQAFGDTGNKGKDVKGLASRARYLSSGLVYAGLALYAFKMLFAHDSGKSNKKEQVQQLLEQPFGQWMLGIVAVIMAATGIYQCYYGLSEKYRKHVTKSGNSINNKLLHLAGKIGYLARGIVWLLIAWMFLKAALHSRSSEAGDTSDAFSFLAGANYGSYLLAGIGIGLVCYGTFNFIRARFERF